MAAPESYPEELRYHREHDWARIDGDEAVLGITWYAQDALGELVHYEPPEEGSTVTKDSSYGEVESVNDGRELLGDLACVDVGGFDARGQRIAGEVEPGSEDVVA